MEAFVKPLEGLAEYGQVRRCLKENRGILQVSGCLESQKAHWLYGLSDLHSCRLVVAEDDQRAKEFYEDYRFYEPMLFCIRLRICCSTMRISRGIC